MLPTTLATPATTTLGTTTRAAVGTQTTTTTSETANQAVNDVQRPSIAQQTMLCKDKQTCLSKRVVYSTEPPCWPHHPQRRSRMPLTPPCHPQLNLQPLIPHPEPSNSITTSQPPTPTLLAATAPETPFKAVSSTQMIDTTLEISNPAANNIQQKSTALETTLHNVVQTRSSEHIIHSINKPWPSQEHQ
jgi:hypothetical protein